MRACVASVDFFIHSGDQIYADGPIQAEVKLDDGSLWRNVVTEAKSKVAQTLDDYRGNFAYNMLDASKRRFAAEVPFLVQWDDHEVRNNWYPGQLIGAAGKRYDERNIDVLAARAPGHVRTQSLPHRQRRSFPHLSRLQPRSAAGGVHAGRAQLSRPQFAQRQRGGTMPTSSGRSRCAGSSRRSCARARPGS
jgi:hypothetical protein